MQLEKGNPVETWPPGVHNLCTNLWVPQEVMHIQIGSVFAS